jgi:secondary thiamine-phosphate synthase enzyme
MIRVRTAAKREIVDITEQVNRFLSKSGSKEGACLLFVLHTTAALAIQEVGEGTEDDLLEVLDKLIPRIRFRHGHDPEHAPDHMLSTIVGPSLVLPTKNGALELGTWQRVLLVELNGPRERSIAVRSL